MKKVRFGIIGLGNQGSHYAEILNSGSIENGILSALCDINEAKIHGIKEKFSDKSYPSFTDYKKMLDSGLCDAVLVETPHYLHPEIAIEALKRDINVIVDKPAGVYAKQVRQMNEAAKKSKAKFAVMFNMRMNCLYRKMREIIAAGGIGRLQRVSWIITNWFRTQDYYDSGSWRATWDGEGGGVLINQCPHQLDLISWVVGEQPSAVRGFCQYGKWRNIEVEDEVTAFLEYESGASGVFITTTGEAPGTNRLEVSGTLGKLVCDGKSLFYHKNDEDSIEVAMTKKGFSRPECNVTEVETDGKNPQHQGIISNFANAILGLEEQFIDGAEGIRNVELMNAIEYSGWLGGERVSLPVDEDAYLEALNEKRASSRIKKAAEERVLDTSNSFGT